MAKNNSNILLLGVLAVGGYFLYKNYSGSSTGVTDTTNAQLTYLDDWAAGNGSLVAIVTGCAAEGSASLNQLYSIAQKFNNNMTVDQLSSSDQAFWLRMQNTYA